MQNEDLITLTSDIVAAHVSHNQLAVAEVAGLVMAVHQALSGLGKESELEVREKIPAVSVRSSIKPDHLVCLECGAKQKTLKRHLRVAHDLTPEAYREAYGLKANYPMSSPEYSERRSGMAKAIGLGKMLGQKRGRKPKAKTGAKN